MTSPPNRAGSPYINRLYEFVNVSCKRNALQSHSEKNDASGGSQSSFHFSQSSFNVASRHQFSLYCHAHVLCILSSRQPFWRTILRRMWLLGYSSQKQKTKQLKQWITLKNNKICLQYQTIASYESCYTTGKKNGLWPPRAILQKSWKESSRVTGRSFSFPMVALMPLKVVTTEAAVLLDRQ